MPGMKPIPISANTPPAGQIFDTWTGDIEYVEDITLSSTTLSMPKAAVTVTAVYKDGSLPIVYGDVDGNEGVTSGDALSVARHVVGLSLLTGDNLTAADVDNDGKITVNDAVWIARKVAGLVDKFPVEE